MLNIVLFGPPGAGKGTQSENIINKYALVHLSTGDLFRMHLDEGTELGKMAQGFMDQGKLVPDHVVISMVEDKIKEHLDARGFIFDGFPRTVNQAEALDKMLTNHNLAISGMVALQVPEAELRKRLLLRGQTSGRADDQNEEKISTRIKVYEDETSPVADYYQSQGKFNAIEGVGSIDAISEQISAVIDSF
ncbi:MAG: adenylate kinase [Cyclobacteriaceae bacterium]|nr:adenylate kinase [Cyclobacteriaceae bacterium HetDA_MAG_MS6]